MEGGRDRWSERRREGREIEEGEGGNDGGRDRWIIVGAKAGREGGREGHREDRGNKRREGGSEWRMEGDRDQGEGEVESIGEDSDTNNILEWIKLVWTPWEFICDGGCLRKSQDIHATSNVITYPCSA